MSRIFSRNCKMYHAAALSSTDYAGATWVEMPMVQTASTANAADELEWTSRGGNGYGQFDAGVKDGTVTFTIIEDPAAEGYDELLAAYNDASPIALAEMNGDESTVGTVGIAGNFVITNFGNQREVRGHSVIDVTAKPNEYIGEYEVTV